jgi:surface protein
MCTCIQLSASTSESGVINTSLIPNGEIDGKYSYIGYDPCCGTNIPIELEYNSGATQWEIYYNNVSGSTISSSSDCPSGNTWVNSNPSISVYQTSGTSCNLDMCFSYQNQLVSSFFWTCSIQHTSFVNGKPYYIMFVSNCTTPTGSVVYWTSTVDRWEHMIISSSILLGYCENPSFYPISNSTYPWVDVYPLPTGFKITSSSFGSCIKPTPTPTPRSYLQTNYLPVNECGVLTIYPMGVICNPTPPTTTGGFGSLSIKITGGTPPYSVTLLNSTGNILRNIPPFNSNQTNITNLLPSTYFLEITDQFGDFQVLINCTIDTPTPTPTPTPTQTPPLAPTCFCMIGRIWDCKVVEYIKFSWTFCSGSLINSLPSWTSSTGNELVYYDPMLGYRVSGSTSSILNQPGFVNPSTQVPCNRIYAPAIDVSGSYQSIYNQLLGFKNWIGLNVGGSVQVLNSVSEGSCTPTPSFSPTPTPTSTPFLPISCSPSTYFESVWDTTKVKPNITTNANQIKLPLPYSTTRNCIVDWGDGVTENITTFPSYPIHTYSIPGVYTIKIYGNLGEWAFNGVGDITKILSVNQWGGCFVLSTGGFWGCRNLTLNTVIDTPIISVGLRNTFQNCISLTTINNISSWDLSSTTSLFSTFLGCTSFDDDISSWDVSNVTNMSKMLDNTSMSQTNYDNLLVNWSVLPSLQSNVNLGVQGLTYSIIGAGAARAILTSPPYNWNIVGDTGV